MPRGISSAPRPHGFLRRVVRAPLWIYHRNLGFLLGKRFLYLAHQGRLSGLRRETVLEVVKLDHEAGEVIVFSGWGNRADWVKNLRAGRALELRIGHLRLLEPEHRFLPDEERRAVLVDYKEAHPLAWRTLARLMGLPEDPKNDDIGDLRAVAFRPSGGHRPH
ncbi:nitroreductase family deazaflavin-dependent oxidoreductase [Actinoallomurus sp. NPDC052308]|uniref:nitroreductase family deazaflavin-dependent oxidoreductase n=1 Tax=Actinoallomurus sp. NPDC052308 TaxID=3155530 RepID=UPI00343AC7B8